MRVQRNSRPSPTLRSHDPGSPSRAPTLRAPHLKEHVEVFVGNDVPIELSACCFSPLSTNRRAFSVVTQQPDCGMGERYVIAGTNDDPVFAVPNYVHGAAGCRCDHRETRCHRFQEDDTKALVKCME